MGGSYPLLHTLPGNEKTDASRSFRRDGASFSTQRGALSISTQRGALSSSEICAAQISSETATASRVRIRRPGAAESGVSGACGVSSPSSRSCSS